MKTVMILLLVLLSGTVVVAESDRFTFTSDRTEARLAKGKERTILTGNAKVTSRSTIITADKIELYGDDFRYAVCTGDVRVVDQDKGIILTCEELFFDREKSISRAESYAEMQDQKNELVVKGGYLLNNGDEEITIIQIGVRILKENMVCRSEFARYRRSEDILELSGMPVVYKDEDEYRASRIIINIETDEITLEGEVKGTIESGEESSGEEREDGDAGESPENGDSPATATEEDR